MNIIQVRSDKIYQRIMKAEKDKKEDIFRYELMKPFEFKWKCMMVPLKAKVENGYDVIRASSMLGFLAPKIIGNGEKESIDIISDDKLWQLCDETIKLSLGKFKKEGHELKVKEYKYSIVLADPNSPYTKLSEGYFGDGGIPGYIFLLVVPNEYTLKRIPVALAHECNHNVRFQFIKWSNDITLEEMMINEGLAENFATEIYGEEMVGPWVSKIDEEMLEKIKPILKEGLNKTGFDGITAYLYGDEIAEIRGYFPVGLPYCAGYACGYHMIKYYLKKTGKSIVEATLLPYEDIIRELKEFWN